MLKTFGFFLVFSGVIKWEFWSKMGKITKTFLISVKYSNFATLSRNHTTKKNLWHHHFRYDIVSKIFSRGLIYFIKIILPKFVLRSIFAIKDRVRWWSHDPGWSGWSSVSPHLEPRQCYKLLINHILRLPNVKRFIPARRDPSFVRPGSHFVDGMKKLISLKKSIEVHFNRS